MSLDLIVGLSLPLIFLLFLVAEALAGTGRAFAPIRNWRWIGLVGLVAALAVNGLVPPLVVTALSVPELGALRSLGAWGWLPALLMTTFLTYWIHRIQHRSDLLWRLLGHQLHHSVQRVDISSAMIIHPFDVALQTSVTAIAATLLGVTPEAAAVAGVLGFVIALYQHWNVRTPRWTGFLIQRPEAHLLHHERGVHSRNFGDLPLWDMLFGTYANPAHVDVEVGFEPERSRQWAAMLIGRDVNRAADAERGRLPV